MANIKCAQSDEDVMIPKQKNGTDVCIDGSQEQSEIIYTAVDTIVKYLNNNEAYRPMHATVMGCSQNRKS